MYTEYLALIGIGSEELNNKVNSMLSLQLGWEPIGSVSMIPFMKPNGGNPPLESYLISQAMGKRKI